MGTTDRRVDEYIADAAEFARPILKHIRAVVHRACPDVRETIRWGFPHFDYKGILCSMAAFRQHCAFGFWKASLLRDPEGILTPSGAAAMGRLGRITNLKDLPPDKVMIRYIREAARLNAEGIKARPPTRKAAEMEIPPDLASALAKNSKAQETFARFPPSHRREYVEWITDARKPETMARRVATAVEWLAQGKSRNWKYEKK